MKAGMIGMTSYEDDKRHCEPDSKTFIFTFTKTMKLYGQVEVIAHNRKDAAKKARKVFDDRDERTKWNDCTESKERMSCIEVAK